MAMLNRFFTDKANRWMVAVFAAAAYLVMVNLDYAPLWHDEGVLAITGKNLLHTGGYNAWDGRTLFVGGNGTAINSKLQIVSYPPWPAIPTALGIALFGENEIGVRFFHSILGLASLVVFWLLLRLDFLHQPRLRVLAFTLFALSTQTILFMRQGRYVADAFFFTLLTFYAYRLYIGAGGKLRHLAVASLATVLNFLNHFAIGASFALALAVWHLLYHFQDTSRRRWGEIIDAAMISGTLCFLYLFAADIIFSDEKLEFQKAHEYPWLKRHAYLIFFNFRDLMRQGWLPLWMAAWFAWFVARHIIRKFVANTSRRKNDARADEENNIIRWSVLLLLFLLFSGLLAVRGQVKTHPIADMRYIAPALMFTALIIAACIDWLWKQKWGVLCAVPILILAIVSNVPSYPYIFPNQWTREKLRLLLPSLISEIHRPYEGSLNEALTYLNKHARRGDTIYVFPWRDSAVLQFYLSDRLIFCCALDEDSGLPKEKIRQFKIPIYRGDILPVWYVSFGVDDSIPDIYQLMFSSSKHFFPTQRPELEFHTFTPLPVGKVIMRIYRRKDIPIKD